nr:MAG TPA: ATPase [Bacteriophage sp.]
MSEFQLKYVYKDGLIAPIGVPVNNNFLDKLPKGVYNFTVKEKQNGLLLGFSPVEDFKIPENIVGQDKQLTRVINTYNRLGKQMGVLLSGIGGAGKTVLAKRIAMECVNKGNMSVIVVNSETVGHLPMMMNMLNEDVVILLDEFEKMFDKVDKQNYLLTLLDGVANHKHLFLFTCNDASKINPYMLHRPSRIRYHFKFDRVPKEIAHEIIERDYIPVDNNNVAVLKLLTDMVNGLSYDMLFECIKECNLYPSENPMELVSDLSLEISDVNLQNYDVMFRLGDKVYDLEDFEEVIGERVIDNVTYRLGLEDQNVKRNINVDGLNDTVVRNNWMFFVMQAESEVDGESREDSTDITFQLKLNNPLAHSLLKDEFIADVEVTGFNTNVYGWVKVNTLEKLLEVFPELNKIEFLYRKKS